MGPLLLADAQILTLRERLSRSPGDIETRIRLVRGMLGSEDAEEAVALSDSAAAGASWADIRLRVLHGIALEALERWGEAEELYVALSQDPAGRSIREDIRARARLVRDRLLQQEAREALQREALLGADLVDPTTVAVLPFRVVGGEVGPEALGRAFAELLTTDLAIVERVQVVERIQVQALIDEMELASAGLVEEETAARSGRLLGAGRLVQGTLTLEADEIMADANVVTVDRGAESSPFTRADAIEQLLGLQAQVALGVFEELGIELAPAQRARILDKPGVRLEALVAFGEGLRSYDLGALQEAETHFQRALEMSPGFEAVGLRLTDVTQKLNANAPALAGRAASAQQLQEGVEALQEQISPAQVRVPLVDALGADQATPLAPAVEILFRRPGT